MRLLQDKPNDAGFKLFFASTKEKDKVIPMQYARAMHKFNYFRSNPKAYVEVNNTYITGPIHFANTNFRPDENKRFFDIDLLTAYGTWLVNYKRGKFNYHVGGSKHYYKNNSWFLYKDFSKNDVEVYKFEFLIHTTGREQSKLYRRWFLKTTKVKDIYLTNNSISGRIMIPNIKGLAQRFMDEVNSYDRHILKIHSIVVTSGENAVYIDADELSKAMRVKNARNGAMSDLAKMRIASSTGYLSIADKVLYYTMINHVKAKLFELMDYFERWNIERPDDTIDIVAANTDGITIYGDESLELVLDSLIQYEFNDRSCFKFSIDNIYTYEEAKFTANDVRKA